MKLKIIFLIFVISIFNPKIIGDEKNKILDLENSKEEVIKSNINAPQTFLMHIVKRGDTLTSISRQYSVDKKIIIDINKIQNENNIYVGQIIKIIHNNSINSESEITNENYYHKILEGETLTQISLKYGISIDTLMKLNNIDNINSINVGTNLLVNNKFLEVEKNIKNKKYGPLTIKSEELEYKGGRNLLNAINNKGQKLIIAIKCIEREIDVRKIGQRWKGWLPSEANFENELLNDFCS